jgi:hypothetical protein
VRRSERARQALDRAFSEFVERYVVGHALACPQKNGSK